MTKPRIFLVEDDDILAKTTGWRVEKLGYEYAGRASRGREAIRLIAELRPDIVLMDINLSGEMDGIAVAEIVRRESKIPVIFLTSHMDKETIHRARQTGADGYLTKPFDNKDLMTAIELALR